MLDNNLTEKQELKNRLHVSVKPKARKFVLQYFIQDNIIGKRFGELIVTAVHKEKDKIICTCECSCGKILDISYDELFKGHIKSCGHTETKPHKKFQDLTGRRFGKIIVLNSTEKRSKEGYVIWRCRCDCGNEIEIASRNLVKGYTTHCGCSRNYKGNTSFDDLTGKTFGKLTVLSKSEQRSYKGSVIWKCRCECGKLTEASQDQLVFHKKISCGCHRSECAVNAYQSLEFINGTCVNWLENRGTRADNTTGHEGVSFVAGRNTYRAYINLCGTRYNLGRFKKIEEAIAVRELAKDILHRAFIDAYRQWEKHEDDWKEQHPFEYQRMSRDELMDAISAKQSN